MKQILNPKYLRSNIAPENLQEAASLLLDLGSREAAVARYNQLIDMDTDVGYLAAAQIKSKIERADEINAWSRQLNMFLKESLKNRDPETVMGESAVEWDGSQAINYMFGPAFYLPNSTTLVELYLRLRSNVINSGLVGILTSPLSATHNRKDPSDVAKRVENGEKIGFDYQNKLGFVFFSTHNAISAYENLSTEPGGKVAIYRSSPSQVTFKYGNTTTTTSSALFISYLRLLYNLSLSNPVRYVEDTPDEIAVTTMGILLDGYNTSGDIQQMPTYSVINNKYLNEGYPTSSVRDYGDFPGIHLIKEGENPFFKEIFKIGGSVAAQALGYRAMMSLVTNPTIAARAAAVPAASALLNAGTRSLMIAGRAVPVVGLVAIGIGIATYILLDNVGTHVVGARDFDLNHGGLLDANGLLIQPDSEEFRAYENSGLFSGSSIDRCQGVHAGFCQKEEVARDIFGIINANVAPSYDLLYAAGAVSTLGNSGYRRM